MNNKDMFDNQIESILHSKLDNIKASDELIAKTLLRVNSSDTADSVRVTDIPKKTSKKRKIIAISTISSIAAISIAVLGALGIFFLSNDSQRSSNSITNRSTKEVKVNALFNDVTNDLDEAYYEADYESSDSESFEIFHEADMPRQAIVVGVSNSDSFGCSDVKIQKMITRRDVYYYDYQDYPNVSLVPTSRNAYYRHSKKICEINDWMKEI